MARERRALAWATSLALSATRRSTSSAAALSLSPCKGSYAVSRHRTVEAPRARRPGAVRRLGPGPVNSIAGRRACPAIRRSPQGQTRTKWPTLDSGVAERRLGRAVPNETLQHNVGWAVTRSGRCSAGQSLRLHASRPTGAIGFRGPRTAVVCCLRRTAPAAGPPSHPPRCHTHTCA